ncbi:hypothetical protein AB3X91_33745 [Paraburkholderia sp. BR14263]|uniref:hypothetical protein n=1 Tax=unclassified Paraburkholderia TaxID=2615204 RepID=UPI0034CE9688
MPAAPQYYKSKADMAKCLFHVRNTESFAFATKRAALKHITAALPEWEGKYDRFPRNAAAPGIETTRVAVSGYDEVPGGCRFWSARALDHWVHNRKRKDYRKAFRHEHIVPRNVVRDFVLGPATLRGQDPDSEWPVPFSGVAHTESFLEHVGIGAVIHVDEEDLLDPDGFPSDLAAPVVDSWARYRVANQVDPSFMVYDLSKATPAF